MGLESVAATLNGEEAPDLCEALVFRRPELDGRDGRSNLWPSEMPELKPAVIGYFQTLARLARDLYRLSETALDLPADYLTPYFEEPSFTLRLVNYPEQPTPPKVGELRYGAHHDYSGLTILHQDDAPGGLQVCDRDGRWRDVPHQPAPSSSMSAAAVALDQRPLAIDPAPRRQSAARRARLDPKTVGRLLTGPDRASEIGVLPSCVSDANPAKYPPENAGEYTRAKVMASHDLRRA